jgi:hypothetical protein
MKIVIKEREFEYVSDYPAGWKYSAGDPYKFPVTIGGYPCFVKRFEKKSPEDISGWNLLQRLKGKNEPNLSRLHDIANVDENGKDIYYVFFEYLDGTTLDKLIPGKTKISLDRLNEDLFIAFNSLKTNGFWFVDFCEKNIFLDKSGKFLLVDLDSTYPVEETPDKDMYGSKDYWGLVLDFYKKVLHKNDVKLDQLDSTSFNYLQIPFLLLHIIVYYAGKEKDYTAIRLFDQLPQLLDVVAPQIKEVFLKAFENGRNEPLAGPDLAMLKDIIKTKVINYTPGEVITPAHDEKPEVVFFKADKELVTNGEKVTFSWQVRHAERVEIFKNKASIKQLPSGETSLQLTEFFDSDKKESSYTLAAYSKTGSAQSAAVALKLRTKKKSKAWLIVTAVIVVAIGVFYFLSSSGGRGDIYPIELNLVEDSVVTVHVKDLVDTSTVKVFVDGHAAEKISISNNNLVVKVPDTKDTSGQEDIMVTLSVEDNNGAKLYSYPMAYTKQVVVKSIPSSLYETSKMNITGKSLNIAGLSVSVNDTDAPVVAQQFRKLTFSIPEIADNTTGQPVEVVVTNKGASIFKKKYTIRHKILHLTDIAGNANWRGGVLSLVDSSRSYGTSLVFQDLSRTPYGFVTVSPKKMEDGTIYDKVMRTHPQWSNNGVIYGVFPSVNLNYARIFKAKIGFWQDSVGVNKSEDGVRFRVKIHYYINGTEKIFDLYSVHKTFDERLIDVEVKIPAQIPQQFIVELAVDAGATSNTDWAAWVDPRIDTKYFYSTPRTLRPNRYKTEFEKIKLMVQPLLR